MDPGRVRRFLPGRRPARHRGATSELAKLRYGAENRRCRAQPLRAARRTAGGRRAVTEGSEVMPELASESRSRPAARVARIAHARRYAEIVTILVKYGFDDAVRALHLTPSIRVGRRLMAVTGHRVPPEATRARRIRLALEAL